MGLGFLMLMLAIVPLTCSGLQWQDLEHQFDCNILFQINPKNHSVDLSTDLPRDSKQLIMVSLFYLFISHYWFYKNYYFMLSHYILIGNMSCSCN